MGTSLWLAWSSIRRTHDVAMLAGAVFRVLASLNLAAGALMVALFAVTGRPLILILSTMGLALATRGHGHDGWCCRNTVHPPPNAGDDQRRKGRGSGPTRRRIHRGVSGRL